MTSSPGKDWKKHLREARRLEKRIDRAMQKAEQKAKVLEQKRQKAAQRRVQARKKLGKGILGMARMMPLLGLLILIGAVLGGMEN